MQELSRSGTWEQAPAARGEVQDLALRVFAGGGAARTVTEPDVNAVTERQIPQSRSLAQSCRSCSFISEGIYSLASPLTITLCRHSAGRREISSPGSRYGGFISSGRSTGAAACLKIVMKCSCSKGRSEEKKIVTLSFHSFAT